MPNKKYSIFSSQREWHRPQNLLSLGRQPISSCIHIINYQSKRAKDDKEIIVFVSSFKAKTEPQAFGCGERKLAQNASASRGISYFRENHFQALFIWRRASHNKKASLLCRDLTLRVLSYCKFFFIYMAGELASYSRSRYRIPRSRYRILEISLSNTRDLVYEVSYKINEEGW